MSKFLDLRIDGAGDLIWTQNDVEVARMDSSANVTTKGTVNGGYIPAPAPSGDTSGATDTAALNALLADGACILLGTALSTAPYWLNGPLNMTTHSSLMGRGQNLTNIKRAANVSVISAVGSNAVPLRNVRVTGVTIDGNNGAGYTATLVQQSYLRDPVMRDVTLFGAEGIALDQLEVWDFQSDNLIISSSGGNSAGAGTYPAHKIEASATDVSNNMHFRGYRNEAYGADGALTVVNNSTRQCIHIFFTDYKIEAHTARGGGPIMSLTQAKDVKFVSGHFDHTGGLAAGLSQGVDLISVFGGQDIRFSKTWFDAGTFAASDMRSLFNFDGSTNAIDGISLEDVQFFQGTGSQPTTDIRFAGTVNNYREAGVSWNTARTWTNGHWSAMPTSLIQSATERSRDEIAMAATGILGGTGLVSEQPGSATSLGSNAGSVSNNLQGSLVGLKAGDVVTSLWAFVASTGTGVTAFKLGLYKKDGTFLGATSDLTGALAANALSGGAISGGPILIDKTDGYYIAAWSLNGTTSLTLQRAASFTGGSQVLAGSGVRPYMNVSAQSAMSGNVTPAAATTAFSFWWS